MFFTQLDQMLQDNQSVNINLLKNGNRLFISLVPKVLKMSEEAMGKLQPLSLNGTPAELDQGFFEVISQPVQERLGLISNVDAFKKCTKSQGSDQKSLNTGNSNFKKDNKPTKKEQMMSGAKGHEDAKRWPQAYELYKKLSEAEPNDQMLKAKVTEIWGKMVHKPSLFNFEPAGETIQTVDSTVSQPDNRLENNTMLDDTVDIPVTEKTDFQNITNNEPAKVGEVIAEKQDMFASIMSMAQNM